MFKSTQQRPPRFGTRKAEALLKKERRRQRSFKKRYLAALIKGGVPPQAAETLARIAVDVNARYAVFYPQDGITTN